MAKNFPEPPPHPSLISKNPDLVKTVDERLSFEKTSSQWLFEDNDSRTEYQYNFILERWIPKIQQDISEDSFLTGGKRKQDEDTEEQENKQIIKKLKKEKLQAVKNEINCLKDNQNKNLAHNENLQGKERSRPNTGVYVTNLPRDITKDDLFEAFSKFGLISEDYKNGGPRIKMYYEENGTFKGDALIIYHSEESMPIAIELLNDSFLKPPATKDQKKIKVQKAEFNSSNENEAITNPESRVKKVLSPEEKELLNQRKEMMKRKLTDWDDYDTGSADHSSSPVHTRDKSDLIKRKIWDKIVVAEKMFRIEELLMDPLLELDLKEDIQEECDKHFIGNDITNVKIYDKSGVITIKFNKVELADRCVESFNGRFFDGLKLSARKFNGEQFELSEKDED